MSGKDIGKYQARPFRMDDGEELESILAAAGINGLSMRGDDLPQDLINVVLSLAANPASKERFGRFITSVWKHELNEQIDDAEDEDNEALAAELRIKKRKQYRRLPPTARNEILQSLYGQKAFKDFLSGYLNLLPGDIAQQMKKAAQEALQGVRGLTTGSQEDTGSGTNKSEG